MKAYELLASPEAWCQDSPAEGAQSEKLHALDPSAVKWCVLGAIQRVYPPAQWQEAMERLLRVLNVSKLGITQMTSSDRACCLMEWNDGQDSSFAEIREILRMADV